MHPVDRFFFLGVPTEFPSSFQNDPQVLNVFRNLFPIAPHVV